MVETKVFIAELLGSFFFFSVILTVVADPSINIMAIPIALLGAIYFGGKISGGHFNPAVTIMMLLKGKIELMLSFVYIIAQILGAIFAVLLNNYLFYI
jgi:aquaporin Z